MGTASFYRRNCQRTCQRTGKGIWFKKKQLILFRVQIGAFRDRRNADSLAAQARSAGFEAFVLAENGLYKVQAGAFSDRRNAEQMVQHLAAAGFEAIIL
ncbi:SPOR domain-containing protein [Bacillus mesophilum]|uniref:SPOR domain-containing protein n=1 Tax=Bacillus mesophilum TaxID=1071718 RepID=A0A7V7UW36_9BACI|nr:SPOR domain-containing protein [Bacillus mesophilum]